MIVKRNRYVEMVEHDVRERETLELEMLRQRLNEPAVVPHDESDEEGK